MQNTYEYRIPPGRHIAGLALCGTLALGVGYLAATNQAALQGFKTVSFSAAEASVIYGAVAVLFLLGAGTCIFMLRKSLKGPVSIVLGEKDLALPGALFSDKMIVIAYAQIQKVSLHSVQNQQVLLVDILNGGSRVSSLGFASELEFERFYKELTENIKRQPSR